MAGAVPAQGIYSVPGVCWRTQETRLLGNGVSGRTWVEVGKNFRQPRTLTLACAEPLKILFVFIAVLGWSSRSCTHRCSQVLFIQ